MIKYNLICKCKKVFESWFSSSSEFDSLCKKKLIKCIYCESPSVKKTMMAPNLSSKSNKIFKKTKLEKSIKKQLVDFRKYIEKINSWESKIKGLPDGNFPTSFNWNDKYK